MERHIEYEKLWGENTSSYALNKLIFFEKNDFFYWSTTEMIKIV